MFADIREFLRMRIDTDMIFDNPWIQIGYG